MRPAMEPELDVGESDLMQILSHVVEEVRDSVGQDIDGAELLYGLLNAPWLQSLLKVYECLQQYLKSSTMPHLPYASGLSLEILSDLQALPYPSQEARELYTLLTEPNMQALLSAHDVVGLKDYEPILPPLPEDLPVDEEAMRIVCLVKNKQPLKSRVGRGIRSHWDTLRQRFIPTQKAQSGALCTKKSDNDAPPKLINPTSPIPAQLRPQLYSKHASGSCRLCQNSVFGNQSLSCSAPCVCNSIVIDDLETVGDPHMRKPILSVHPHCSLSPWTHDVTHFSLTPCCCHPSIRPLLPPRMARYAHTAPPSPMHRHRLVEAMRNAPVELAKQESLDELRSVVQQAANRMERNSKDVHLLGQRMADATELMSESVQENAQALALLAQVVEKLQGLVAAGGAASAQLTAAVHEPEALEKTEESVGDIACNAKPASLTRTVFTHEEEACEDDGIANICGSATYSAKPQGNVTSSSATSAPRTAASTEDPLGGKSYMVHASPVHSTFTRCSRCPSCSSSSSSSSFSSFSGSISVPLQPVASQGRLTQKSSPKNVAKMHTSPRRRDNGQHMVPNGLEGSSSSQTLRNSCSGIGCLSDPKKKKRKKKKK